jgi:hypothetical protein
MFHEPKTMSARAQATDDLVYVWYKPWHLVSGYDDMLDGTGPCTLLHSIRAMC